VSINGVAAGMKSVAVVDGKLEVFFVVPTALPIDPTNGSSYPLVINDNGAEYKSNVLLVAARPDVFTTGTPGPGGRAKMFNVTNRVPTTEPFTVFTVMIRGGRRVSSHMRLYLTGVGSFSANSTLTVRIGNATAAAGSILSAPVLVEPGVYYVDFTMPSSLRGAGDQPVVVTVTVGGVNFTSRLDDTAPKVFILD
jgi:hypothetical protein